MEMSIFCKYVHFGAILAISAITALLCLVLFDHNAHNYVRSIYYVWLVVGIVAIACFSLINGKIRIKATPLDGLVLLFFVYLTLNYMFVSPVDASIRYLNTIYLLLLYLSFRILLTANPNSAKILFLVFILSGLAQSLYGLAQGVGFCDSGREFPITGTFYNPGPYGGYLAVTVALGASYIIKRIRLLGRNRRTVSLSLSQGALMSSDPEFQCQKGDNLKGLQDYAGAEAQYKYAFNMVPNRITPLYLLMKLYVVSQEREKAMEMAQKVLIFTPKVNAHTVEHFKQEAEQLLRNRDEK